MSSTFDERRNTVRARTNEGVAVCYDYLHCEGGGEFVALHLAQLFEAPLYVAFSNDRVIANSPDHGVTVKALSRTPPSSLRGMSIVQSIFQFWTAKRSDEKIMIFSGTQAVNGIRHRSEKALCVYYCHTPPRYAYDLHNWWIQRLPYWKRPLLRLATALIRHSYQRAVGRMNVVLANSKNVQARLKKYLNIDARVVYPPVDVEAFTWIAQKNYYLSMARLEGYKRVELVVRAFTRMPEKTLIVMSGGSELEALQKIAANHSNISFTGWVSQHNKIELVGNAIATIYVSIDEDFGISPVESMAAGKPVIGVDEGGLRETVIHSETGVLLKGVLTEERIVEAVTRMHPKRAEAMRTSCENRAAIFSTQRFDDNMLDIIAEHTHVQGE